MLENYTEKRQPSKFAKNFFDIFEPIVFALIAVVMISIFVARLTVVDGSSMETTLSDKQYIVVSDFMLSYEPKQGDIIVVQGDFKGDYYDKPIVKRVIATGGQAVRIEFQDGDSKPARVYVDGELYETKNAIYKGELYQYESLYFGYPPTYIPGIDEKPIGANPNYNYETKVYETVVPDGMYFLMGDNRYHSADSRITDIGCVPQKYIIGKAIFRLTPFSKMGGLYKD